MILILKGKFSFAEGKKGKRMNGCPNDGLHFQKHIKYIKNKQRKKE